MQMRVFERFKLLVNAISFHYVIATGKIEEPRENFTSYPSTTPDPTFKPLKCRHSVKKLALHSTVPDIPSNYPNTNFRNFQYFIEQPIEINSSITAATKDSSRLIHRTQVWGNREASMKSQFEPISSAAAPIEVKALVTSASSGSSRGFTGFMVTRRANRKMSRLTAADK